MTTDNMLTLNIDGKEVKAAPGELLIQVADREGVYIPRFCYHEKLSIAASCRMCLVDVERMPKPAPACATPVMDGMVVRTRSEKAKAAQRSVMEFLLINHPLDCPVCDQGGECELQDFSLQYGSKHSLYDEEKRHYEKIDIGPLVETYMNRCIQCTRCVRYGEEIAGLRELGGVNRGDRLEITTYVERSLASEVSANIIDICPVGALTAKPSKYQARPWEYKSHDSLSIHDGIGTNTAIHTYRNEIARVVSRRNDVINETWISDRDRFSYEAIYSPDRALTPLIDREANGHLEEASWGEALTATRLIVEGALEKYGADEIAFLISPSATLEEHYLAHQIAQKLGVKQFDYRFNQRDFVADADEPAYRSLGLAVDEVSELDSAFLIGADLRMEAPVLAIQLRKAAANGANISYLNTHLSDPLHDVSLLLSTPVFEWKQQLASILKSISSEKSEPVNGALSSLLSSVKVTEEAEKIAADLMSGEKGWVLLGSDAQNHPEFATLRALAMEIARLSGASFGYLTEGANASGANLVRRLEGDRKNIAEIFSTQRRVYILIGAIDPELDFAHPEVMTHLEGADAVIALTPFASDVVKQISKVILPIGAWGETSGTLVSLEGKAQSVRGAAEPVGEARPLWKVLRVLGNEFDVEACDYVSSYDVLNACLAALPELSPTNFMPITALSQSIDLEGNVNVPLRSIYGSDAYVRRSPALQKTVLSLAGEAKLGESDVTPHFIKEVAPNTVLIPVGAGSGIEYYSLNRGAN